jgi:hypothetical protein
MQDLLGGSAGEVGLKLHGVVIREGKMTMEELEKYCHPDGYLYFTF